MPQTYTVVRPFKATNAISGREREFKPRERVVIALGMRRRETVRLEFEGSSFLVAGSTFKSCCEMALKRTLIWVLVTFAGVVALASWTNWLARFVEVSLIERSSRPASRIFEGFAYSGVAKEETIGTTLRSFLPFPSTKPLLPPEFLPGHYYVFYHPPGDDMRIAQEVLAPRIRAEGFEMTEGVGANGIFFRGFAHLDLISGDGLTVWSIQFKRRDCVGEISHGDAPEIRHSPWPVVRDRWDPTAYLLHLEGSCDL